MWQIPLKVIKNIKNIRQQRLWKIRLRIFFLKRNAAKTNEQKQSFADHGSDLVVRFD